MKKSNVNNKDFFSEVYNVVLQIPKGKVTTYGIVAELIGAKKSARVVGWALNNCDKKKVPAHRVVNRVGQLTGKIHFDNLNQMQEKLEKEGIKVINDKIVNFNEKIWDPLAKNIE